MADRHKSAIRQHRRSLRARIRNRRNMAQLRTQLKQIRALIASGNVTQATAQLQPTLSLIDHSSTRGVIHRNAAARYKSRLARQVNKLA